MEIPEIQINLGKESPRIAAQTEAGMKSNAERCAEYEQFKQIDAAFRAGDLAALRAAVDDPADVPNGPMPLTIGPCLEYAIYHSPLPFIRTLLEIGADPNPVHHIGFPPLIAALACSRPQPGSPGRPDVQAILQQLLACQADPNQRGINDYTALHMAVSERNQRAVELLLQAGADPHLRTRVDECETPRAMAEKLGLRSIAELLREAEARLGKGERP
jgi:ankyrin repeat protein